MHNIPPDNLKEIEDFKTKYSKLLDQSPELASAWLESELAMNANKLANFQVARQLARTPLKDQKVTPVSIKDN